VRIFFCLQDCVTASGLVKRMLASLYKAASLCTPYLDGRCNVDASEVNEHANEGEVSDIDGFIEENDDQRSLGPEVTLLVTGSWCTMKEISFTLASVTSHLPISPTGSSSSSSQGFVTSDQIRSVADFFVAMLSTVKHNGATEKLHLGFEAFCRRLLLIQDQAVNSIPKQCVTKLLAVLKVKGQSRSDIVRRSAGLPLAFVALCHSEPSGTSKRLLPTAIKELLKAANGSCIEEPWPRVHAFNCLRMIFQSATLSVDSSAWFAQGMEAAINAMQAAEWEVRC
jgi:thyroid adenoma-associated protein